MSAPIVPDELLEAARAARRVTVLTGAGMSAESGLATFRDPGNGLWERFSPESLATPHAWARDPALVWAWYLWRFETAAHAHPNAGHRAIARWEQVPGVQVRVVTQNVDDLHERAGSSEVVHVHGAIHALRCGECSRPHRQPVPAHVAGAERMEPPACTDCAGLIRPGVVWFGEQLPLAEWFLAEAATQDADLVLVVGTSAAVYPAAGLPALARAHGAFVAEVNPVETAASDLAEVCWRESAARALPALVDALGEPS